MEYNLDSFFKLTEYVFCFSKRNCKYPVFKLRRDKTAYFKTIDEAEASIKKRFDVYAFVVTELPYNWRVDTDLKAESLSERVYLPDGSLWGANTYYIMEQDYCPMPLGTLELGHYLGAKRMFHGRKDNEIRFKPGDIVDVFGYPGNQYWSPNEVTLGVILRTPPTKEEIQKEKEQYIATHSDYDISPHALGYEFGCCRDVYVVATKWGIDKSPTTATLPPSLPITPQRKATMERLFKKYK